MPRTNNPTLGSIACPDCGEPADVCQTARGKGRFLYTRCASCGTDQRAGKQVQTRLYYQTDWREGVQPERPPNVEGRTGTTEPNPAPVPVQEPVEPVIESGSEPLQEPEQPQTPEPKKQPKGHSGGWAMVAGFLAIALLPFKGGM